MSLTSRMVTVWYPPTSTRGYRSKHAAFERWAQDLIKARCECERGDDISPGYTCARHEADTYRRLKRRLSRWLRWSAKLRGER